MKAPLTWIPMCFGALFAAVFGGSLVAYIWLPQPSKDGTYLSVVITSGLFAIACLGASRIEEHDGDLARKERELTDRVEAVRARREKLRRLA